MFSELVTGAGRRDLYCFEPRATVGVPTVPFSSQDIRGFRKSQNLGLLLGHELLIRT